MPSSASWASLGLIWHSAHVLPWQRRDGEMRSPPHTLLRSGPGLFFFSGVYRQLPLDNSCYCLGYISVKLCCWCTWVRVWVRILRPRRRRASGEGKRVLCKGIGSCTAQDGLAASSGWTSVLFCLDQWCLGAGWILGLDFWIRSWENSKSTSSHIMNCYRFSVDLTGGVMSTSTKLGWRSSTLCNKYFKRVV